jgi:tyrosine-specific transport protein
MKFLHKKKKHSSLLTFEAVATLVGTIIGAGILGIPYTLSRAGFLTGALTLIGVGIMVTFLNLFVGELVLRTKEPRQLPGYAAYFLGDWAKHLFATVLIAGVFGALVAYIIGIGTSFAAIFGGPGLVWGIGFALAMSLVIWRGVSVIKSFELIMLAIIFVIVGIIAVMSNGYFQLSHLDMTFHPMSMFTAYGVALFAFGGTSAIRPVREILNKNEHKLQAVIIISSLIPLLAYLFFAFIVIAVTGANTAEVATIGLGQVVGPNLLVLGNLFAIFAMGTSFLTMSLVLKETLDYDYKIPRQWAWALTTVMPIAVILAGVDSFITVISWVGAIGGGIQGILIVLMYWRSDTKKYRGNRKPEYDIGPHKLIGAILIAMFAIGIYMTVVGS